MTEIEERRRKQMPKILITEIFMGVAIVVLVVVLALMAMGYSLSIGSGVEHTGLVQLNSTPTGAAIEVDGEGIFMPTNQSRTMTRGEHHVKLSRDGYSSWEKSIKVTDGMMYRLVYPRLYKLDRESDTIKIFEESSPHIGQFPTKVEVSKDHTRMYLDYKGLEGRMVVNLSDGTVSLRKEDAQEKEETEKLRDGMIKVLDNAELKALEKGMDKVAEETAAATGKTSSIGEAAGEKSYKYSIYIYDGAEPVLIRQTNANVAKAVLGHYYGDDYLAILEDQHLEIYYGRRPRRGESVEQMTKLVDKELGFQPTSLSLHGKQELLVASSATELAVLDAESFSLTSFAAPGEFGWASEFNIYTTVDGVLTVYDFDGTNSFEISKEAANAMPAVISENDRYIYYFNNKKELIRETIR